MLSRFHLIPERDGQTDGRTDGRTDGQNCYINIARDKNGRMNDIVIQKNTDSTITPQK